MATYATQQDFENYVPGWETTDPDALESLLERAEKDIDRIVVRSSDLTNSMFAFSLSGASGGTFGIELQWQGRSYAVESIPWDADGNTLLAYLNEMTDAIGNTVPPASWQVPEVNYYTQRWAFGPLPGKAVVVEAWNYLGQQPLPLPTLDITALQGTGNANITQVVKGGLRVNPYLLSGEDAYILKNATCAQAEYRNEMGEPFFRRAQWKSTSGPEFRTQGRLPLIGPKVMAELSGSDLVQRGARARPGTLAGRVMTWVPAGGLPIPDDWRY